MLIYLYISDICSKYSNTIRIWASIWSALLINIPEHRGAFFILLLFFFKCMTSLFSGWQQCVWSFSVLNSCGTSMFNALPMIGGPQAFWKVILLPSSISVSPQRTAAFSPSPQTTLPRWVKKWKFCFDVKSIAQFELQMFILMRIKLTNKFARNKRFELKKPLWLKNASKPWKKFRLLLSYCKSSFSRIPPNTFKR